MRIFLGAALLLLISFSGGCSRDFAIPEQGADIVPPALASLGVSPAAAADGATVTILLEATEALPATRSDGADNPRVELVDATGETAVAICTGEGSSRSCSLEIDGSIAEGTAEVLITLEDAAGNSSGRIDTRSPVEIDRTAPTLLLRISPDPTSRGDPVALELVSLFELLGAAPTIESSILESIECLGIPPTGRFDCTAWVTNTQLTESDLVTARAIDLAGNEGETNVVLEVQDPAPELSPLTVSQNPVMGGETLVLHTVSNVEVMRCDGTVGGQVAPCTADEDGLIIDCSFVVPLALSEGAYRTEIICENFSGFARTSGELYVDHEPPIVLGGAILERTPGGVADAAVGLPGVLVDRVGTLDYPGRRVVSVRFLSNNQLLAEGPVNPDGSFRLPLPADAGCEPFGNPAGLYLVAVDAAGNISAPVHPTHLSATLRVGLETCLNSRQQTLVAAAYAGRDPQEVSPGHFLAAGTVLSDPGPLASADGNSLRISGDAVDASIASAVDITTVNSPLNRSFAAMAYHPPSGKVVLFGGDDGSGGVFGDTWTYDGSDWTQLTTVNTPADRTRHAMVFDPLDGRILLLGGVDDGGGYLEDFWGWDGSDWNDLGESPGIYGHQLVYDAERFQVLSVGGTHANTPGYSYIRRLGASGLEPIFGQGTPPPGENQGSAWDAAAGRLVVHDPGTLLESHTDFDPATLLWDPGFATTPVEHPALTYAAGAGRVISHGGLTNGTTANSAFRVLDRGSAEWTTVANSNANQYRQAITYDSDRDVVVAFGGEPNGSSTTELSYREARPTTAAHAFAILKPHNPFQALAEAQVTWVGSGSGNLDGDTSPDPGARLRVFENGLPSTQRADHAASSSDPVAARTLGVLLDDESFDAGRVWVVVQALPSGDEGTGGPSSELISDAFEVRVEIER